jgi:hypothetical protein
MVNLGLFYDRLTLILDCATSFQLFLPIPTVKSFSTIKASYGMGP